MPDAARIPPLLLIHGAWQGSWSFDAWMPELARHGVRAHAIDLPGNGWPPHADAPASLKTYTAHVIGALKALDEPVVLVGHSGGGITASQVAETIPERVAALVYLAGMMLPSATSFGDIIHMCEADSPGVPFDGIAPYLDHLEGGAVTQVRTEGALKIFVHDCEPAAANKAAGLLRPQQESGRKMRPQLSAGRFGKVPRIYVECSADRSVLLPLQRKMQALTPGARVIRMQCGHVPQLAQPALLADLLCARLGAMFGQPA